MPRNGISFSKSHPTLIQSETYQKVKGIISLFKVSPSAVGFEKYNFGLISTALTIRGSTAISDVNHML